MGWIDGWPSDPVPPKGSLNPIAVVTHRTYGGWGGDYSVGKNQGLFQFLIGQDPGQYVQFMDTTSVAYHCNGANFKAFGVELTGTNEDALTDWQVEKLGEVLHYANTEHGIPLVYTDPIATPDASIHVNDGNFRGIISHVSVQTDDGSSQHTDYITVADFDKALGDSPQPTPPSDEGDDDMALFKTTDNGVVQYWRDAGGYLVPISAQQAYPMAMAGIKTVDLGGGLAAVAYNIETENGRKKIQSAGHLV